VSVPNPKNHSTWVDTCPRCCSRIALLNCLKAGSHAVRLDLLHYFPLQNAFGITYSKGRCEASFHPFILSSIHPSICPVIHPSRHGLFTLTGWRKSGIQMWRDGE